ncbi:MAG: MoxR family ATPase [Deltaproteobacteria bacterium]|nr:MoxR family ATPase [Deltaproteobacteria bacterium]
MSKEELEQQVEEFRDKFNLIASEVSKKIVGQKGVLRLTLTAIFAGGHVLLEGAPGLGKTLLVKSIAQTMGLSFHRIQFTSDLMPTDITGTQVLTEDENGHRSFVFKPGPLFSNIVLADEVNRSGPKTQSALLEAMEEQQISVLGTTHKLEAPFFVLATQNPIELEGTYPLPEAQLDRFLFKLLVNSPSSSELKEILNRTTGTKDVKLGPVFNATETRDIIMAMRSFVRQVIVAPPLEDLLVGIIFALTPGSNHCTESVRQYVRFGPGPRAAQAILLTAKVLALLDGRVNLAYEDIKQVLIPALRHRLILNYQAEAEGVTSDQLIQEVEEKS